MVKYVIEKIMIKEKEEVHGIIPATMSILKSDLTLDNEKTLQHAENLLESGSNFVVFFGSTGQSQLLSSGEKRQFIQYCSQSKYKKRFQTLHKQLGKYCIFCILFKT